MIYFDYAATTPIHPEALNVWIEASREFFGNSSSLHDYGHKAAQLLNVSRQQLADLLQVNKESVIFTSGGTESNVLAIETLLATEAQRRHIIISQTEHASLHQFIQKLQQQGYEVTYLQHTEDGTVDLHHLTASLSDETCLVIVQHVNSEIGVIQPIEKIKHVLKDRDIFLHVDCVQSFAKIPLDTIRSCCDSLSIASHKVYGPKGIGAVIFPNQHTLKQALPNVSHEFGFRAGTVNVPGVAAFVTAAKLLAERIDEEWKRMSDLRTQFIKQLRKYELDFQLIQSDTNQLPHIIALTFAGLQGPSMMIELNRRGFAVSTGSACQIDKQEPSKAMLAMGKSVAEAHQLLRISFGTATTEGDVNELAACIGDIITS